MPLVEKLREHLGKDEHFEAATREYSHLDNRIRYIVYGHTHEPKQAAVRVIEAPEGRKEHLYLNSGTWRTRYHKSKEGLGFIGWKNLSYVTFYRAEERGTTFPTFETWTGTLKNI